MDISGYSYLEFYVKDTVGSNNFKIFFKDTSNAETSIWTDNQSSPSKGMSALNAWTKITYPLSSVTGVNKAAIKEIRLCEWNNGIYYLDDVYFAANELDGFPAFGGTPTPTPIPTPTVTPTPAGGTTWYQNFEAVNGFTAGTGATVTLSASNGANSPGLNSVNLTTTTAGDPGTTLQCVNITPQSGTSIDASGYAQFIFYIKDTQGPNTNRVTLVDTSNAVWSGWSSQANVQNQWTKINIAMSTVTGINKAAIKEIRIGEWNAGTYYIDDVYFAQNASDLVPSFGTITMFTDGFESNNFTAGGWTNNGCALSSAYKNTGTYSSEFNSADTLTKARSTVGYNNIVVQYARYTRACETDDYFAAEWYNGSTWTTLENTSGNVSWAVQTWNLPAGAANNANFQVRFKTVHNGTGDYAHVDDVKITGTP